MSRADRHALLTLGSLVILESTLGVVLHGAPWTHTALFAVDALLGVFVFAFAVAIEPEGPRS